MTLRLPAMLFCGLLMACGGRGPGGGNSVDNGSAPVVLGVAPSTLRVGDDVTVAGRNFMTSDQGQSYLKITGRYFDHAGQEYPFDRTFEATVASNSLVWRLWPDIVFDPQGNRGGHFLGVVRVINEGLDGSRSASEGYDVRFDIAPSVVLRALRPTRDWYALSTSNRNSPCSAMIVPETTENTPLAMAVEALGMMPGTHDDPLVFAWSFAPDGLGVIHIRSDTLGAYEVPAKKQTVTVIDQVTDGTTLSGLMDESGCDDPTPTDLPWFNQLVHDICGADANSPKEYRFAVTDGPGAARGDLRTLLTRFIPAEVDATDGKAQAVISVSATDATGATANLDIPLDVYRQFRLHRESSMDRIVERESIVAVDDPIEPSTEAAEVFYQEAHPEKRTIEMGASGNIKMIRGDGFTLAFGWTLPSRYPGAPPLTTTSAKGSEDISRNVPAGMCVTFYRQAEQVRRFARVTRRDACGNEDEVGAAYLFDWQWSREIATAPECPAPSTLLRPPGPCNEECDAISGPASVPDDFWNPKSH